MANMKKLTRDYGEIIWTGKKCIMGMPISFTRYILTDSKLITRVGLLNLKEDEIELYRVYDKSMKLPFGQRIVGCGTITLLSKDSDTPTKVMQSVKHPRDVKRLLDSAIQEQRDKYSVRGRDMMEPPHTWRTGTATVSPTRLSSPAAHGLSAGSAVFFPINAVYSTNAA
ncbi:MAG: PH domain-containing protein [Oscillospiraceae bacterium]